MRSGIYKITCLLTNKIYVGQTVDLDGRKNKYSRLECKNQFKIYNSLKKYGWEQHIFEILEECFLDQLNEREIYWGTQFNVLGKNGLNLKLGNANGKCSKETKQKISKSNKGKILSKETKQKISKNRIGIKHSQETKNKISKANKDKKRPKLSEALKGKKRPNHSKLMKGKSKPEGFGEKLKENKQRSLNISKSSKGKSKTKLNKTVLCLDKDLNLIKEYPSQIAAQKDLGLSAGAISKGIKTGYLIGGFKWVLKEK